MILKSFLTAILATNAVLGSFCMMPLQMAMAESIPEHHVEMNMSPMDAMSHIDCDNCDQHTPKNEPLTECAGHCLADVSPGTEMSHSSSEYRVRGIAPLGPTLLSIVTTMAQTSTETIVISQQNDEIRTVVLRQ